MQSFAFADVPGLLGTFRRHHPEVEIQVRPAAGGSAVLVEELRRGGLDIAFIALLDPASGVTTIRLGSEELVVVTAPDQVLPGRRPITLDALVDASFVDFPIGWGVRTVVDRAFAAAGLGRRVTIEVADVATCLQLLRAGLGVALLPPSLLPAGDSLRQRAVSPPLTWHVGMATPAGRGANAAATAFAELVTKGSP